jgi:hypothetical protein
MNSQTDPPPPYSVTPPPNSTTPPTNDIASCRYPPLAPVTLRVAQRFPRPVTAQQSPRPVTAQLSPRPVTAQQPPRPVTAREQLQRYLIEIITFELVADSSSMGRALGQDRPAASSQEHASILADEEKIELLRLALIVEDLHEKFTHNQWTLALDCDRKTILHAIIEPSRSVSLCPDYAMDLISTYAK